MSSQRSSSLMTHPLTRGAVRFCRSSSGVMVILGVALVIAGSHLDQIVISVIAGLLLIAGLALRFARQELRHDSALRERQRAQRAIDEHTAKLSEFVASVDRLSKAIEQHEDELATLGRHAREVAELPARFDAIERSFSVLKSRRAWTSTRGSSLRELEMSDVMASVDPARDRHS